MSDQPELRSLVPVGFVEGCTLDCSCPSGLACYTSKVGHLTSLLVAACTLMWAVGCLEGVVIGYSSGRVGSQVCSVRLN